jgi:hypothetical protein
MATMFGASSKYSDLQKEELWPQYVGRPFSWNLSVTEVSKETLGDGFTVQFKCQGSNSFIQDVMITFPANSKSQVLKLEKGSVYKINGRLTAYNSFIGLSAEPE